MVIGIVGLGMIGGSLAKAFKRAGLRVYGYDRDKNTLQLAQINHDIDGFLTRKRFGECDRIFLAIRPRDAVAWLEKNAPFLTEKTLVIDCCGTKRMICDRAFELMENSDLRFVGGHPIAGNQYSGFKHSAANMFDGTTFIVVMKNPNDIFLLDEVQKTVMLAGCRGVTRMTAEEHDRVIALTSQLSHIVSSAFVKSDNALTKGCDVTGGSFRDMTRVAHLNGSMWSELCMGNRDNALHELDGLIGELSNFRDALSSGDGNRLERLFTEGSLRKDRIDHNMRS